MIKHFCKKKKHDVIVLDAVNAQTKDYEEFYKFALKLPDYTVS